MKKTIIHTPATGPWHVCDSTQVIAACGSHVADCSHSKDDKQGRHVAASNARLVAAAPDLLDIVKDIVKNGTHPLVIGKAIHVIYDIEGKL